MGQMGKHYHINFMRWRGIALALSGVALLISLTVMLWRGFDLGLDFTGGAILEVGYEHPVELADINAVLTEQGFTQGQAIVQYFGSRRDILIRLEAQTDEATSANVTDTLFRALTTATHDSIELRRVEFVGPQVGEELREQGGLAVLFSLIGILIYVALRFEWRFALGAVAALIHDVIFTLGIFSIFHLPFDLSVLAAVLAVIGYSLNDTIVIFDRIRENFRRMRKGTVLDIVNQSINQTLSRTIITSGTTLIVLAALYLLGGEAIRGFSFALIIGIVVGTYSTIYIATAIAVWLGISRSDLLPPTKEGVVLDDRP
jgi:preprotein translocase subunit SecF